MTKKRSLRIDSLRMWAKHRQTLARDFTCGFSQMGGLLLF